MSFPALVRRPASPADWARVRELCCLTGNAGEPIARERWRDFGAFWVGPYQRHFPEWTYVVESNGRIEGYLTGCPDTAALLKRRGLGDLWLRARMAARLFGAGVKDRTYYRRVLALEREAMGRTPAAYPAHLHVNVDAALRGQGAGARLVEAFCADLRAAGIPGVHLRCGPKPVPFYSRLGFQELERTEFSPGRPVFRLGLKLL